MAGRIRTIKPEILDDAITAGSSHAAFRLFVGMIVIADDHGNLRADPRWLEAQVFHSCPLPEGVSIVDLLDELGRKLVGLYQVEGQHYAHLNGWQKHQRVDNAAEPRVPLPPGWNLKRVERREGRRTRYRFESSGPLVVSGAAVGRPRPPPAAVVVGGAAGSRSPIPIPITDHDHRPSDPARTRDRANGRTDAQVIEEGLREMIGDDPWPEPFSKTAAVLAGRVVAHDREHPPLEEVLSLLILEKSDALARGAIGIGALVNRFSELLDPRVFAAADAEPISDGPIAGMDDPEERRRRLSAIRRDEDDSREASSPSRPEPLAKGAVA